jgi:hypothetical protein
MENRWILITVLIILLFIPLQVTAYSNNNIGGHPSINEFAVLYFEQNIRPADPLLKDTSIRGEASWGWAWDETDGIVDIAPRNMVSNLRSKLLHQWIEDGGFSADEPEYTMSLVHFYDPAHPEQAYLTDLRFLQEFGEFMEADFANPHLSAVDWAFDRDLGYGYFIQDYSWDDGLQYYQAALASTTRENPSYGQAWRAVGETMHLVSDMTVPAHVRNDGHAWSDPYEDSVGSHEVYVYAAGTPIALNYDQGTLRDVMIRIANVVNRNFYSADTTPIRYETLAGGEYTTYTYSDPSLEGLSPDAQGYYYSPIARALAREDVSLFQPALPVGILKRVYRVDENVLNDQRKVLIPTAIRGSAEVLDRFLPRFDARLSVEKYLPEDPDDDQYVVHSTLKQVHTEPDAWQGYDLVVRNGAYLVETTPDGWQNEMPLSLTPVWATPPADPTFNNWKDLYKFEPGTRLYMKYDLGGYVITSNEVTIPPRSTLTPTTTTPTPTPPWATATPTGTSTVQTTSQPTVRATWGCVNTAACTPDHPENCCPGTTFNDGPCAGCELCCVWINQTNPTTGEQGYYALRAFCNCKTGETVSYTSEDTNPWKGVPGY